MDDVLRVRYSSFICSLHSFNCFQTLSQFPRSRTSVKRVHLVESSLALRAVQEKKLQAWGGKSSLELHWHDSVEDIPTTDSIYTMLVAHEFFDALPFHLIEVCSRCLYRCQTLTLNVIEKSSRLERGLDHLYSRSSCKDYPETFRRLLP